jgi:hypothetical protein
MSNKIHMQIFFKKIILGLKIFFEIFFEIFEMGMSEVSYMRSPPALGRRGITPRGVIELC